MMARPPAFLRKASPMTSDLLAAVAASVRIDVAVRPQNVTAVMREYAVASPCLKRVLATYWALMLALVGHSAQSLDSEWLLALQLPKARSSQQLPLS